MVQAERINAASTIALFEKLEADNPGKKRIYVFADNARYHHARLVRQWLERRGLGSAPGRGVIPTLARAEWSLARSSGEVRAGCWAAMDVLR